LSPLLSFTKLKDKLLDGSKTQTIRKKRKHPILVDLVKNKMEDFEELWLVPDDDDANDLIRLGWKFIQIVYDAVELQQAGWFSVKTIGAKKIPRYLMGRPKGIPKRDGEFAVWQYIKRIEGKK